MGEYSNLETVLLSYVYQCVANGKTAELEQIGVTIDDMRIIRKLPIMDIKRLKPGVKKIVKKIQLDKQVLQELFDQANRVTQEDNMINRLIEAGANYRMLNHYFGTTKSDLSLRRKLLNVQQLGRPKNGCFNLIKKRDTYVMIDIVKQHIRKLKKENRQQATFQCDALLLTSEYTNTPVNIIWDTVEKAERLGSFTWQQ